MNKIISLFLLIIICSNSFSLQAQQTETKSYGRSVYGGDVQMGYNWGEYRSGVAEKVFVVSAPFSGYYYLKALANRLRGEKLTLFVNGVPLAIIYPEQEGWQWLGNKIDNIKLVKGKNDIRFTGTDNAVPMVEEISLTTYNPWARASTVNTPGDEFIEQTKRLSRQPSIATGSDVDATARVLPNPEGIYSHAIDTTFSYSHFSWIYLPVGSHNFSTTGSTIDRALTIFNPNNYTYSWSNVNGGPGGEASLPLYIVSAGYYAIMLRPVTDAQIGTTNIVYNGNVLVANAMIGGRRLAMGSLRGGALNHFTCKLTSGSYPDTRLIVSRFHMSSARGYNDDYGSNGGTWAWGYSSRIKKTFTGSDSVQYGYVCAYSPTSTGKCDIYLGTGNNSVPLLEPTNFPALTVDDAIKSAESSGNYNCISWSGGVTASWSWPPYALSTYSCTSGNVLQCFDNFYSNNPVRYPGAWNYTRTGATVANAVVDLWKTATVYTHASVRAPGNNHPHGYDWESKPGSLDRLFHPRNALNNASWYGFVNDYYKPTGTYARTAGATKHFATDADAVKAGVAVFDVALLTPGAQAKLAKLLQQVDPAFMRQFNELYIAWDKTKAANASHSNPSMYCKNAEHDALAALAKKNMLACLVLVMDKFVNGNDHLMGDLLLSLTLGKYSRLLDEVKQERLAKPNDEMGRHRIHGDHDNGVLYIEKILKELAEQTEIKPVAEMVQVTVSPNPVKDWLTIKLNITGTSRVSVQAVSAQTRASKMVLAEKELAAGNYQYTINTAGFVGGTGDIITVQVMIDGVLKTIKVMVGK